MNAINSNNLVSGTNHSNDINFMRSENCLSDLNNLSPVDSCQLSTNPVHVNGSNTNIDISKANYEIPADECWLFKPPKKNQIHGSVEPIKLMMASDASEFKDNQVEIEEVYKQVQKICENYKLFVESDNALNELYSTSLNLSCIRDDYETIKRELSIIKANRQVARDALLASGFQCPDDLSRNS
ncbi:hypothetical protein EWB00_007761 [Schistosoma japonicum]|uniref:Uncharacterized protein n=1 Tax=Schistosoma japonicum TaxID=6182 RepID=A0A4Z2CTJ5_SCHJA|nr:hypothetical protein EWB00_007761 [Schistosoma japonicum]